MYLFINNLSDECKTFLALVKDMSLANLTWLYTAKDHGKSENILKGLERLLKKAGITVADLKGVIVVKGAGSFVGIRVALSITNTIAWANNIPAAGIKLSLSVIPHRGNEANIKKGLEKIKKAKKGEPVRAFYGKEPHITYPQQHG